jgi:lipoprotein-releasing system permease protein
MLTAGAAVAATIFLIIFNSIVVGGVVHGVERDLGEKQRGHVWISNNQGLLDRPDDQIITYLMINPEIMGAAPRTFASFDLELRKSGEVHEAFGIQAIGIDPILEQSASSLEASMIEGEFVLQRGDLVLDKSLSEDLDAELGSFVEVIAQRPGGEETLRMTIVGIFDVPGPILFGDTILIHHSDLKDLLGLDERYSSGIMVRLHDPKMAESVKDWVLESYASDDSLRVQTVDDYAGGVITAYEEGIAFVGVLSYSGMAASGLGVITILMMMVNSKVREIGILRAIGMTGKDILTIFIIDGAILGVVGAVLGAIGGSLISFYLAQNPVALFSGLVPNIIFEPEALVFPMIFGFSLSVIASIYPAVRASLYQPEEAMRYV